MAVLFPLVPILFAGLFSSACLLAGDLLEGAERAIVERADLWIGGSGLLGGILGGSIARLAGDRVGSEGTLAIGVVLLALAAIVCHRGHAARPAEPRKIDEAKPAPQVGLRRIFEDDYARAIAIVAALGSGRRDLARRSAPVDGGGVGRLHPKALASGSCGRGRPRSDDPAPRFVTDGRGPGSGPRALM